MALTSTSTFAATDGVIVYFDTGIGEPVLKRVSWTLSDDGSGSVGQFFTRGRPPISGEDGYTELGILQTIFASDDGFQDSDGNSIDVGLHGFPYGTSVDDIEQNGYYNPLDVDSYDRWVQGHLRVPGTFLRHATVAKDSVSGRSDISMGGGIKPVKAVPPSGDLNQSVSDWFAEATGSNARFSLNALPGEEFDNGSSGVAGTEAEGDVRVRAMIVYLESIRSIGDVLYDDDNPLSDITEWSSSIFSGRTFSLTLNTLGDQLIFTISSSTSGAARLTFTIARTGTSDAVNVDSLNEIINDATVTFPTEDEDDVPPFGDTAVPVRMERAVMAGGEFVIDRDIPAFWKPTKRKPIGARDILRWEDLEVVTGETYRNLPFGYFNFAVHITATVDRVIRVPNPEDIVPYVEGAIEFEVHNNNAYSDGKKVELQTADGTNIITLLGKESVPFELEWFKDGTGELRSPTRPPRILVVAGSSLGDFNDVGYWEFDSTHWARPIFMPGIAQRTVPLRINEEAFELGTAAITNGSSFSAAATDLHTPEGIKLLKPGRLSYDQGIVIAGQNAGTITGHRLQLYEIDGSTRGLLADYPQVPLTVNEGRPWDINWADEGGNIGVDDVFLPIYQYAKSSTMNPSDVLLKSSRLAMTLLQDILVSYP